MWYSQGTINATNNSATIVGSGTQFIANVRVGDGITIQGSQSLHEVVGIASDTQMTIRPAFTGTSGAGKQFACAPILGYDKDLSDAFNQLRLQFGDKLSSLQPWAYAATASAALDSLGFSDSGKSVATGTPAQGRAGLGLKSAATMDVGTASGNVMEVGAFGLGGRYRNGNLTTGSYLGYYDASAPPENFPTGAHRYGAILSILHSFNGVSSEIVIPHVGGRIMFRSSRIDDFIDILHTDNILTTTGQSTEYPMTQKAVTDAINGVSDRRDKVDITPSGVGLDLLEKLEPVSFRLNKRDWYRNQAATSIETHTYEDGTQTEVEKINPDVIAKPLTDYDTNDESLARDNKYTGLIAQDVKTALEDLGLGDLAIIKNYSDEYEGGDDRHYIEYNGLIPVMINAIKELSARVKELEDKG